MNPHKSQKIRVSLVQIPHLNMVFMLQLFVGEQNAIFPTNSWVKFLFWHRGEIEMHLQEFILK